MADEPAPVAWHTEVATAWSETCQKGRPLLLFVTCENCRFCDKMKQGTYARADVAEMINRSFVPLVVDGRDRAPLVQELKVKYYPCTFIISPQAVILARFEGYVSPEQFADRMTLLQIPSGVANVAQGR
jgi:protein disulfide-isomerase